MISNSKANSLAIATATARARATATAEAPLIATAQAHATATAIVNAYDAATATGVMDGFDAEHTNFNPYEKVISPANVSELVEGWAVSTVDPVSAPTVANGVAYVESDKLYAFNAAGCSHPFCSPLWTASIGLYTPSGASSGVGGGAGGFPPAVANGVVYVSSVNGRLYAFRATGCGHPSCSPLWTASMGYSPLTPSPPAVANGVVYVDSDKLYAFNATGCGHPSCSPLWTASISTWSSPAVANGVVYVDSDKLYAFRATGCGHPSCSPLWTSIGLGGSSGDLGSSPAVANGVVYVSTVDSRLYAFNATGCGHPSCSPLWTSSTRSNDMGSWPMVVANGVIYGNVSLGSSLSPYLYAFRATGCGHPSCSPLWIIHLPVGIGTGGPIESPVIANGVVYFSESDQVFTFYLPGTAP